MAGDYTVVNLAEARDVAEAYGIGDAMEARFPSRDLGLERSGISYQRLRPGKRQPFGHRHERQEEIYVVLAGSGRINLDGEVVELRAMDAVRIAPAVTRCLEAGEEGLEFMAFGAPSFENPLDDVENLPGWWG